MFIRRIRNATIGAFLLIIVLAQCGTAGIPAPNRKTFTPKPPTKVAIQPTATASLIPTTIPASPVPTTAPMNMVDMKEDNHTEDIDNHDQETLSVGDPAKGKILFEKGNGNPAVPTCITCHNVESPDVKVGPSLADIAGHGSSHAAEHGQDIETFLHESIVAPNKQIMEAPANYVFGVNGVSLMYQNYGKDLTVQEINDLIAYLLTLKASDEHGGDEHADGEDEHTDSKPTDDNHADGKDEHTDSKSTDDSHTNNDKHDEKDTHND